MGCWRLCAVRVPGVVVLSGSRCARAAVVLFAAGGLVRVVFSFVWEVRSSTQVAVRIRLKRVGKKFSPVYRVVVVDARKKRDGRVIEEIGLYDPMQEPSLIRISSERARYWLGVGAQPSSAVHNLLRITGDYQAFRGLPAPEGGLRVRDEAAVVRDREAAVRGAAEDAERRKATAAARVRAGAGARGA